MTDNGTLLEQERYISLETFRADGSAVRTPVWAAALDGKLVIVTDGTSFKVKRLRANAKCRVAGCDARGKTIHTPWRDATCRILDDADHVKRAHAALKDKYGWQVSILDLGAWLARRTARRAYLELSLQP
jgi:PPOX class probable F420-dependent enzyme